MARRIQRYETPCERCGVIRVTKHPIRSAAFCRSCSHIKDRTDIVQQVREQCVEDPGSGCWYWQGVVNRLGYGQIRVEGRIELVHRAAFIGYYGTLGEGLVVDHECHNRDANCRGGATCLHRRCANPCHMAAVTIAENVMRGKGLGASNARKTHCKHGHEFTEENTYRSPSRPRNRWCRKCLASRKASSAAT